ncbi:type IV pilus secretin PilQ [Marinicella sp. W31]|uniref:type IV pilus secretin PilQ n=1 Tax=Marinicella sp. W31 TaxID=3023713 RepID=UPI0037575518
MINKNRISTIATKAYQKLIISLLGVFLASHVVAQVNLQDVTYSSGSAGATDIRFTFDAPVSEPEVFVTGVPARIALDFSGTVYSSDKRNMNVGLGSTKSIRIVTTDTKTRAVVDLIRSTQHTVSVQGNTVVLTVAGAVSSASQSQSSGGAGTLQNVDFRRGKDGQGVVKLMFSQPNTIVNLSKVNNKILLTASNSQLAEAMDRKIDVIDFATPVAYVDARQSGQSVNIEVEPVGEYVHSAYQTGNEYVLEVTRYEAPEEETSGSFDEDQEYAGNLVSFTFQDIPVRSALQLIADASQLNIVVADNVTGSVTLRLQDVPWDQALDIILESKQLDQRRNGDVIWIAPAVDIAAREQQKLEAAREKEELEPLRTIYIQVNYAKASELAELLMGDANEGGGDNSLLSERGSVTFDERTNTLLVSDIPDRLEVVENLVDTLDRSVEQVQIESRIVVATDRFGDELGVRFGVTGSHEDRHGNIISTGGSANATDRLNNAALARRQISRSGSGLPTFTPGDEFGDPIEGAPLGERLNVNLPTARTNAGRWAFSILAADYLLDLELSALEVEDRGEVISTPRVITANQTQATIKQGVDIPYEQATSSGATSIEFREAVLALTVTPLITPDERIDLTLKVDQDAIGEEVSTSLGGSIPSIDTRSIETRVLVDNGQTIVLGGIYEQVRRQTRNKVPFLGDIPGVGNLFRNRIIEDNKGELLIFVTPTIIKENF